MERVRDLVRAHQWKPVSELGAVLLDAVKAFARGAAQQDDITIVLVKRDTPNRVFGYFDRNVSALPDIVAFTDAFFGREGLDAGLRQGVDLTLEELFTNMVKYSPASARVRVDLTRIAGGVEATLTDYDVEPFDVTQAPDVDVGAPIEQRKPGGLGLHLIRRMVDSIDYAYSKDARQSRITFRKTLAGNAGRVTGAQTGDSSAGH